MESYKAFSKKATFSKLTHVQAHNKEFFPGLKEFPPFWSFHHQANLSYALFQAVNLLIKSL